MAQRPLMLKEYLELESSLDPLCYWSPPQLAGGATIRRLLETELRRDSVRKGRAITKLAAVITAVRLLKFSPASRGRNRSFSKSLSRRFWRRTGDERDLGKNRRVMVKEVVLQRATDGEENAIVNSCSSSSDGGVDSAPDFIRSSRGSSELFEEGKQQPATSPGPKKRLLAGVGDDSGRLSSAGREPEEICEKAVVECHSEEEKEQLSPVSVMDFPYNEEDDDDDVAKSSPSSPSFLQFVAKIERTKDQLLQKIRRFESLAELDPVDLDHRFASDEDSSESTVHVSAEGGEEEQRRSRAAAWAIFCRLAGGSQVSWTEEKLLVEFFVEGLSAGADNGEMLRAASRWIAAGGDAAEHDGAAVLREMERRGGWKLFEEEEATAVVAADVAGSLVTVVLEEVVDELMCME